MAEKPLQIFGLVGGVAIYVYTVYARTSIDVQASKGVGQG